MNYAFIRELITEFSGMEPEQMRRPRIGRPTGRVPGRKRTEGPPGETAVLR